MSQSIEAVEYTECISAERKDSPNERPVNDTKQPDGEAPVMLGLLWMQRTPLLLLLPYPF